MKSRVIWILIKKIIKALPWSLQDRLVFLYYFGHLPHIKNPVSFNEKVLFRKVYQCQVKSFSVLSDKYRVRKYVSDTIGDAYLVPIYLVTSNPQDLNNVIFDKDIIIKPNHCAGFYAILKTDAPDIYRREIIKNSYAWLNVDFSKIQREKHYKNIPPCLLAEKLLGDGFIAPIDYKFHIFNGRNDSFNYVLQLISNRFSGEIYRAFYVNNLTELFHKDDNFLCDDVPLDLLFKALEMSRKLSIHFDYVRVDWYLYEDCLYFGELTFTPAAGFGTGLGDTLDKMMGEFWAIKSLDELNDFPNLENYQ